MKLITALAPRFATALLAVLACAAPILGASPPAIGGQPDSTEMEQTLYVQAPDFPGAANSIVLVWLPEPLDSTCLGRTMKECFNIDYCIRTTNPNSAQCKNLGIPRARLPHYPPGMQPHRAISVVLRAPGNSNGFDRLKEFYTRAPKDTLERLSKDATIHARIRYTSTPSDEGFYLLEVLAAPPL